MSVALETTRLEDVVGSAGYREDEPAIEEALFIWKDTTADFAECLIGARNRRLGCRATATFDAKASKLPGFIAA